MENKDLVLDMENNIIVQNITEINAYIKKSTDVGGDYLDRIEGYFEDVLDIKGIRSTEDYKAFRAAWIKHQKTGSGTNVAEFLAKCVVADMTPYIEPAK